MSHLDDSRRDAELGIAILCGDAWAGSSMAAALASGGMSVQRFTHPIALLSALRCEGTRLAIVEDREPTFGNFMAALRAKGRPALPIVAMGAGSLEDMRRVFSLGADDYAIVGDAENHLLNRIHARLEKQAPSAASEDLRCGPVVLERLSRTLRLRSLQVSLGWREFELAWLLFEHLGHVVNLNAISIRVWGTDISVAKRTIEQHASQLRKKLGFICANSSEAFRLHAVNNIGYRLVHLTAPAPLETDLAP